MKTNRLVYAEERVSDARQWYAMNKREQVRANKRKRMPSNSTALMANDVGERERGSQAGPAIMVVVVVVVVGGEEGPGRRG